MKKKNTNELGFRKFEHGVVKVEDAILAIFMIVLTASIIIQIACRYVFKIASPWCEELAIFLFIAMTYLGSGRAFATNSHINIDLMDSILEGKAKNPEKAFKIFNIISGLITMSFVAMFATFYYKYLLQIAQRPQESASMHINMLIPMSMILVGSVLMLYHGICRLFYSYESVNSEEK